MLYQRLGRVGLRQRGTQGSYQLSEQGLLQREFLLEVAHPDELQPVDLGAQLFVLVGSDIFQVDSEFTNKLLIVKHHSYFISNFFEKC